MKRKYLIALTFFGVLLLCAIFQLHAELTLEKAEKILTDRKENLQDTNIILADAKGEMRMEEVKWIENEENIGENRIDYASADLWGLGGAVLKQIMDMQDRAEIAVDLGAAIGAVETAKTNADEAQQERDTAWNNYIALAQHLSPGERLSKGTDALPVTYPDISIDCPGCELSWSGSDIDSIADHITSCSVKGHTNTSDDLVNGPVPHFSCQSCPLSHQHYTYACRGGCGEMCKEPFTTTSYSPMGPPAIHSTYYDHGYTCTEDVPGPFRCGRTAFTCQTPACPNDDNHWVSGECKKHKVRKGNPNALNDHKKLTPSVQCPQTHLFTHQLTGQTQVFRCIITRRHECDDPITAHHPWHYFNPNPQQGESRVYPPGYATEQVTSTPETSESPSLAACGIHDVSASGDHASTYLCNIPPCSNRSVPSCLALCPETGNHGN